MLRVAIAGAAHDHIDHVVRELRDSPDLILVGVSDNEPARAHGLADPFGAPVFATTADLLVQTQPDVVALAGIYADRGADTLAALEAGCRVLADKPLCTSIEELDAIEHASASSSGSLALMLEKRYYGPTLVLSRLVEDGELGDIVSLTSSGPHKLLAAQRPEWYFDRARYGGIINDLCVHDIDLVLALTGAESGTIRGGTAGSIEGRDDFALAGLVTLTTPAALASLEAHWLTPAASPVHGDYQMRVVGTEGIAELFWARDTLVFTSTTRQPTEMPLPRGFRPAELVLRAWAEGRAPDISVQQSIAATRLALLAQRSADQGGAIEPWSIDRTPVPIVEIES